MKTRFQFRLRTLFVIFTVVAVILATLPLLTRQVTLVAGPKALRKIKGEKGEMEVLVNTAVDPDANWRLIALLVDASAIGLPIWLVRRKP
jgi:hypothetical protein